MNMFVSWLMNPFTSLFIILFASLRTSLFMNLLNEHVREPAHKLTCEHINEPSFKMFELWLFNFQPSNLSLSSAYLT